MRDEENNNPVPHISSDGLNKTRLKKGGKKPHHLKPPTTRTRTRSKTRTRSRTRSSPSLRLCDHNNNNTLAAISVNKPAGQPGTEPPTGTQTRTQTQTQTRTPHPPKQGAKKELLKSKGVRSERGVTQPPGGHPGPNMTPRSHKPKQGQSPGSSTKNEKLGSTPKSPLHAADNVKILNAPPADAEYLKDGEKVYAGAKFSEPPSPSVLPKPPSHWVGEHEPRRSNHSREQMSVHLKSLLKVQQQS